MLPLDLHVLGLPLAFILSQDQTLHCISLNVCPTPGKTESLHQNGLLLILRCRYNMYMNFFIPNLPNLASRPLESALPYQLSGCKYTHLIFFPQNNFQYFFRKKIN